MQITTEKFLDLVYGFSTCYLNGDLVSDIESTGYSYNKTHWAWTRRKFSIDITGKPHAKYYLRKNLILITGLELPMLLRLSF